MSVFDRLSDLAPERVRPLKRVEYERLVSEGLFAEALMRAAGSGKLVRVQQPLAVSESSLPEPDVAVVVRRDYDEGHPETAFLVAEVANTSLRKDRALKSDVYASAFVPEYWVVNVAEREVEVRTAPREDAYTSLVIVRPGDIIHVASFGGVEIAVSDFLR